MNYYIKTGVFSLVCNYLRPSNNSRQLIINIVLLDTSTTVRRPKPPRRKIFLWKRADLQGIKDDLSDLASSIKGETDVNQAWDSVKCKITQTMDSQVPSKITTSRHTNPWMNTQIKRAIRRKQRAHKKDRETNTKRDRDRYKRLQKEVQFHVRKANKTYMQDTVSNESKDNSKKFWSFVKSKGQEFTGVAPLKNRMVSYKATHSQEPIFLMSNSSQYLQRKISPTYQTKAQVQLQACLRSRSTGMVCTNS